MIIQSLKSLTIEMKYLRCSLNLRYLMESKGKGRSAVTAKMNQTLKRNQKRDLTFYKPQTMKIVKTTRVMKRKVVNMRTNLKVVTLERKVMTYH